MVLTVEFDGRVQVEHKFMITKDSVSLKEFTVEFWEELKSLLEKCWAVSDSDDIRTIVTWAENHPHSV